MSDYGSIITTAGAALEAAALASGVPVNLTMFVVGDGSGSATTPDPSQTALVNEVYRGNISSLTVSGDQGNQLTAQVIVPRDSGGYTIREVGLLADDGTLYSVANYPDQMKPTPDSGTAINLDMEYDLAVSSTTSVTLLFDGDDYLTETQANTLYLRIDANLAEIAASGESAQEEARSNLGLTDMSIADPDDFVKSAGGDVGYLDNASHYGIKPGAWDGAGPFANQYNNPLAPFLIPYGYASAQDVSNYLPIIKGLAQTVNYGFGTAVSFGAYITGAAHFANAAINITGDDGSSLTWFFDSGDGSFGCPGGIAAQGPIYELNQRVYSPNNPQPGQDLSGYIRGDACAQAGFVSQNVDDPYMMFEGATVVELAPRGWTNATFVIAIGLGAQSGAPKNPSNGGEVVAAAGCVISGIGDFGADNGYGYQRPLQYLIAGNWYTSAVLGSIPDNGNGSPDILPAEVTEDITAASHFKLYSPADPVRADVLYLLSDEGYDFYQAREFMTGNVIVGYIPESGIICLIAPTSRHIWPIDMSIAVLDSIPPGCSIDGSWIYSDGVISQSTDAIVQKNKSQRLQRLIASSGYITMYKASAEMGAVQDGDDDALTAWYEYVVALREVDLTQPDPAWPESPAE